MISKRRLALLAFAFAGVGMATELAAQTPAAPKKLNVAFVYVGEIGQYGWTYQHELGRIGVDAAMADRVQTVMAENVAPADAEKAIDKLVEGGSGLIFMTSPSFGTATANAARKYPNVRFEVVGGDQRAENITTFNNRSYEGRYVMGQVAGMVTKTNMIGYVAAHPQPEVIAGINAFTLGAQSVNPKIKVKVIWTRAWVDEDKERAAVQELAKAKADVVGQHTYSPAVLEEAAKLGIKGFGQTSDMSRFAPSATLTSLLDHWTPYYVDRIQRLLDGKWTGTDIYGGVDADLVRLTPVTNAPDGVWDQAKKTLAQLHGGLNPFKGPITRADGKVAVKAGATATEKEVRTMNWFVKGVDGQLPAAPKAAAAQKAPAQKK